MEDESRSGITGLLEDWRRGDQGALGKLVPLIERDLRRIAKQRLARCRAPDSSLTTTSLVQEAYVRLLRGGNPNWHGRSHFFALCAEIIRSIVVDHARARHAAKRGAGVHPIPLDESLVVSDEQSSTLVAVDEALRELAKFAPRQSRVIEMRFFGGLTIAEASEVLGISPETVARDSRLAKMWLMRQLDRQVLHEASRVAGS